MHTSNGMPNTFMSALALVFAIFAGLAGQAFAQEEGGWQLADSTNLCSGCEEGGWQRLGTGSGAFDLIEVAEQPEQPALLSAYPNPFNPETTIRFEVRTAQQVRLSVFNTLGQRVQVLVDGRVEAGTHEARFDAYGLPSGTYFTRLETAADVVTRTMVLAK